jgi:hypothetical protein
MGASRCLLGLIALFVSSANAHAVDCLVSAAPARQADAKAWLTLRAPGGESSTCWYAATRTTGHDYQQRITAIAELIAVPPNAVSSPETYGFNGGLLFEVVPGELLPDGPASFTERFSAVYGGNANTHSAATLATFRVRLRTLSRIAELSQHEADGRKFQKPEGVAVEIFPILGRGKSQQHSRICRSGADLQHWYRRFSL